MTAATLRRLKQMSSEEVSWRTWQMGRTTAQRVSVRVHHPRWERADLREALAEGVLDDVLGGRAGDPRWDDVHAALERHLAARRSRFVLDPAGSADLRQHVLARWPSAAGDASARADRILAGSYDLLGYRNLRFAADGSAVDWHLDPVHGGRSPLLFWADVPYLDPQLGDHKVIWELNRHQHWLQLGRAYWLTGDERYRQTIVDQLEHWMTANPPLVGINWASMLEIGLRSISWVWGLHFLLGIRDSGLGIGDSHEDAPWLVDMLLGLHKQLTHVEQNLSLYFSPNTHLTGEALGLYVVGVALPELAGSARWADTGRRILLSEIDRQIAPDGGHAERSTHYQRYTLDFYLMALLTAHCEGDAGAAARFSDAVLRLADFTRTMADDAGRLPLIGDDDGGTLWPIAGRACHDVRDSLALAAVLLDRADLAPWGIPEEVFWIAGARALPWGEPRVAHQAAPAPHVRSRTFPDTGYVVLRDGSGSHAVFDAGAHGYLNGGHAHADALSLTLTVAGRPLLIDPGTFTYTVNPRLRDTLRSSMSHNTVTLDHRSQAIPAGPFHWQTRADARLHACRHGEGFDWAEASHDGYAPVRHRRTLLRSAQSGWLIADEVLGESAVTASSHWHFDPGWMLKCDAPGRMHARHVDGDSAWLLHDARDVLLVHGDEESGLGWSAPVYGTLVPTWTARTTRHAQAPFAMLTWIGGCADPANPPRLDRLEPVCDAGAGAIGVRLVNGARSTVFLLRPGEPAWRDDRTSGLLDYRTNARVLHYAAENDRLVAIDLIDASHAVAAREDWISITASEPMADLHATIGGGVLDLRASEPPTQLRLQGGAVAGFRHVRLNGRTMAPPPADHPGVLVIYSVDWGFSAHRDSLPSSRPTAADLAHT